MRSLAVFLILAAAALPGRAEEAATTISHGLSMYGDLKYGEGFEHFDYVNPDAPKGGEVKQWAFGGFDSLNPFILKGNPGAGTGLVYDSLLKSSDDEAFSEYGLLADSIEVPEDRSWVAFHINPDARWHDGEPVTVEDVIWTFDTLKTEGHPYYRAYYANIVSAEDIGEGWVRFNFDAPGNRELPLIMGQMQVLPKHWYATRNFADASLEPPMGSGPYRISAVDPGRSITYERVADYWGADLPVNRGFFNFDTIRYDEYLDFDVALEAFKAHEYDFRQENNSKLWATAYTGPAFDNGLVVTEEIANQVPTGMQGFVFNTRKPIFQDPRVRQALGYAFDFEWSNKNLFYDQYTRTQSYFSNSELASSGLPSEAELALLEPLRGQIPDEVFTTEYRAPETDGSGNPRANLRKAQQLLQEAGWTVQNGVLTGPGGEKMEFEIMLVQPAFERIVQPFARNLEKLGAKPTIRIVDASQYQSRMDNFEFDVVVGSWGQSLSPGNEQRDFWGSQAADTPGSRNLIGIKDPAIDSLVDAIIYAKDREALVTATHALDRVLLWNHYVIPNFHITYFRVAYWDKFGRPEINPPYALAFDTWWVNPDEEKELQAEEQAIGIGGD
jgi:microcin C transport system substrate-binding protein